jgi:hypothetical protein
MFRKSDPQRSLFETSNLLPDDKRRRLESGWAAEFARAVLPLIDEDAFAAFYCAGNGRPNKPVRTVVGILLLKEVFDLTDQEALDELEFDLRWQAALQLTPADAHCSQKTLHNFRAKLVAGDRGRLLFETLADGMIRRLGLKPGRQRLDSTHIGSNMAVLTRLGLFCETVRVFLRDLRRRRPLRFAEVPAGLRGRYLDDDGGDVGFDDARSSESRRRLGVAARDVRRLLDRFAGIAEVAEAEPYLLLRRLFDEHCDPTDGPGAPTSDDPDFGEPAAPATPKPAKKLSAASMQSPHDPDATYGLKGKGYELQVCETAGNGELPEAITHVAVTPSYVNDVHATMPAVRDLAERGLRPDELIADTAFASTGNVVACAAMGVELLGPAAKNGGRPVVEATATAARPQAAPDKPASDVLAERRAYQQSDEFARRYAVRAGIEATNSELKRAHGIGRLRVRRRKRVELTIYLKAAACNMKRMVGYLAAAARAAPPHAA